MSTRVWWRIGKRMLRSAAMTISLFAIGAHSAGASEAWNLVGASKFQSAQASSEVLNAVILGLEAFKAAEKNGTEARMKGLQSAADQLDKAQDAMTLVADAYKSEKTSLAPISFDNIPEEAKSSVNNWLARFEEAQPATYADLYLAGVNSSDKLAEIYRELAKRDDGAVFGDFLSATYDYLKAGAVASEIFAAQAQP